MRWRQLPKPLIGGVQGLCIYGGWFYASVCDVLLAADDLRLLPSIANGQFSALPWDLALNARKAKEIIALQRYVLAEEAEELGLVNRVVPRVDLDAELVRMAKVIAKADPFHLRMMKLTVNQAQDAAGYEAQVRAGITVKAATRWNEDAAFAQAADERAFLSSPKALLPGKATTHPSPLLAYNPFDHASSAEVMYYSETAAVRAAQRRRSKM